MKMSTAIAIQLIDVFMLDRIRMGWNKKEV